MSPRPRPGILDVQPYVGGESRAPGGKKPVRLASNENPLGPSPKAIAAYEAEGPDLHRYPDGASAELRAALGTLHDLDPTQIVCGAGSDELIGMLVRAYAGPGDEVLYSAHGFLMYGIAAKSAGATPVTAREANLTADVDALLAKVTERTRLLFLANPNNPTGTYLPADVLQRLHAGLPPEVLMVIDAAYAEYVTAPDYEDGRALVAAQDNVVMTRTFSKIYGLAALRLGWAYCPPAVADVLNRVRAPFNVTRTAQVAGLAAVADQDHVARSRDHNETWRQWLMDNLGGLGLEITPSLGNFLLIQFSDVPGRTAPDALAALKEEGVLLRGMAAYGLPDCLRMTVGTEAENRAAVDALRRFLA